MKKIFLSHLVLVAVIFQAVPASSDSLTTFFDDFEYPATKTENWTATDITLDSQWVVEDDGTVNGVLKVDTIAAQISVAFAGYSQSCSAINGVPIYRNSENFLLEFDLTLKDRDDTNVDAAYGGFFLASDAGTSTHVMVHGINTIHAIDGSGNEFLAANFFLAQINDLGLPSEQLDVLDYIELNNAAFPDGFDPFPYDVFAQYRLTLNIEAAASIYDIYNVATVTLFHEDEDGITPVIAWDQDAGQLTVAILSAEIPTGFVNSVLTFQQGVPGLFMGPGVAIHIDNYLVAGDEVCPENTPVGTNVEVELVQGISMTFDEVTDTGGGALGTTTITRSLDPPPEAPTASAFEFLGEYFDVTTTVTFEGSIELCFPYDDTGMTPEEENGLQILHFNETTLTWDNVTSSIDTVNNVVCATSTSLSVFVLARTSVSAVIQRPLGDNTSLETPAGPFKRGRTIPVKVQLFDGGGLLIADDDAELLTVSLKVFYEQPNSQGQPVEIEENPADSGSEFRYDAESGQFIFNLSTKPAIWLADFTYGVDVFVNGVQVTQVFFSLR